MVIDHTVLLLGGIGAVRGAVQGIARTATDLLGLVLGIPVAFRTVGALGDLLMQGPLGPMVVQVFQR